MSDEYAHPPHAPKPAAQLRILATTDVHMHLIDHDHRTDTTCHARGLARTATLIAQARAECPGALVLTFDNGDILQGTAMGDVMAQPAHLANHPLPQCVAAIGYDAVGLGNHDADYGLAVSGAVFSKLGCPVLSANFCTFAMPDVVPFTILDRKIADSDGVIRPLRIGIFSVLPQQTRLWNYRHLGTLPHIADPVECARALIPQIRAKGADIVVALAHGGVAGADAVDAGENFALALAQVPGIDTIICGHTHLTLPGSDHRGITGVDADRGTLNDVPAVMAGYGGRNLGLIDLDLEHSDHGWRVASAKCAIREVTSDTAQDDRIVAICASAHQVTQAAMAEPIGRSDAHLHSFFALLGPEPGQVLLGRGMIAEVAKASVGTPVEGLPILAAACPGAMGGKGGPFNYFDLPPGAINRRHIAALTPFQDEIWAVTVTGADVLDWLERTAAIYARLTPDEPDQPMTHAYAPGFNFDTLIGVRAVYDPTRPARYSSAGAMMDPAARRVTAATWQGRDIDPAQRFLIATTSYRAAGGGRFPNLGPDRIALRTGVTTADAVTTALAHGMPEQGTAPAWRFADHLGVSAIVSTSPRAMAHLDEIAQFSPQVTGQSDTGFLQLRVSL